MKMYEIPYYFEHEEKIFGGYVSLRQAIYMLLAVISVALFFIRFFSITIKIVLFLIIAGFFCLLAFFKVDGTNADKYIMIILKFLVRKKIYILER